MVKLRSMSSLCNIRNTRGYIRLSDLEGYPQYNGGKREMELNQDAIILQTIISNHGSIWENPRMTKALFMDYYPNNKQLWHALLSCIDESIPNEIIGMDYCSRADYYRFVKRLTNECGYFEELAEKAVSTWLYAIGIQIEEASTEFEKSIMDMPIEELDLSIRLYNTLKRAQIYTIGDLIKQSSEDMMGNYDRIGRRSYEEAIEKLKQNKEVLEKLKKMGVDLNDTNDLDAEHKHSGRDKCDKLRAIRKKIAEANGIDFEPTECHHTGPCLGTCPVCDAEIKYLDEELQKKKMHGEDIILSGLAADFIKQSGCTTNPDIDSDIASVCGEIDEYIMGVDRGGSSDYKVNEEKNGIDDEPVMGMIETPTITAEMGDFLDEEVFDILSDLEADDRKE